MKYKTIKELRANLEQLLNELNDFNDKDPVIFGITAGSTFTSKELLDMKISRESEGFAPYITGEWIKFSIDTKQF
jgi:hypothetical protein